MSSARSGSVAMPGPQLLADLRAQVVRELGLGRARLDQRGAHVARGDLLAQRLAEGADAVLGQVVDAAARADPAARDRADVDQVGDLPRLVLRRAQQVRQRRVGDVEQPVEVERDHPLPLLDRGVDDRAEQHHARVVDHRVEPAELGGRALHGRDRLLAVGDVGLDREPADLGRERVEAVLAAGGEGDLRALRRQRPRRRLADPAARARDERDCAVQCHAGSSTPAA